MKDSAAKFGVSTAAIQNVKKTAELVRRRASSQTSTSKEANAPI